MPIECASSIPIMTPSGSGKSFSVVQNERLRALVVQLQTRFDSQREFAEKLGVAQPTVSNFIAGKTGAGVQFATAVAALAGVTLESAISGGDAATTPRWRNLPGWAEEEKKARKLFPKVRSLAFDRLGNLMGERPPSVSALTIGLLASTWDQTADDEERSDEIAKNAQREMDEEDAAAVKTLRARHEAREKGAPLPPLPGEPKPRAKKAPPLPSAGIAAAERELAKRGAAGIDETSGKKGGR